MSGAAKVLFSLSNLTSVVNNVSTGVVFVQGTAERGPFSDPSEIINSWPQFVAKYGGLLPDNDTPLLCKRLLEKGGKLRFSRVGHYTDISDPTTLDAAKAETSTTKQIKFSEELRTGNVIEVEIDNVEIGSVNFTSDNYNTLKKIGDLIQQHPSVDVVTVQNFDQEPTLNILTNTSATFVLTVTGGTVQPTITQSNVLTITDSEGNELFRVSPKYAGLDFNNVSVIITPTTNGVTNAFNLSVVHRTEPMLNESYPNLVMDGSNNYLNKVATGSSLIDVEYVSTTAAQPNPTVIYFSGGSDGTTPQLTDYIGDEAGKNGLHAFNEYYDSFYLATFDDVDIDSAGVSYCSVRDDMAYIIHLSGETKQTLIEEKRSKMIDDKHAYFTAGSLKIIDPFTNTQKVVKETADVLALAVASDNNNGPWYSFAGPNRGLISGVLGVGSNFGSPAKYKDLDELADNNINMVINRDNSVKLWGNFSGQMKNNQERYFNVVKLVFFIKRALRPILETFLEEPNDIQTWSTIYYSVKPLFDSLKDRRAIYTYDWQGDQFATNMNDLKVNKPSDVTQGKYKVILVLSAINSLQEIHVGIVLTDAGVEFEIIDNNK